MVDIELRLFSGTYPRPDSRSNTSPVRFALPVFLQPKHGQKFDIFAKNFSSKKIKLLMFFT
jgi:hypothetical protein